jgi:hypothetical protein
VLYPDLNEPVQVEGQLMGNLMCFPLLCLQNYIAFRWIFPASVPVKVNGDDIVFKCTREEYERWASFVGQVGLVLSRGKTLVSEKYFSLNSAFFWARRDKPPRPVPVTRVSFFGKKFEDWGSLRGSFRSFVSNFGGRARLEAECIFLRYFRRRVLQAGRSVVRGLGIPASVVALQRCGLWRRECWYFDSVPAAVDCLPLSPSRLRWGSLPPGWERVPSNSVRVRREIRFLPEGAVAPKVKASKIPDWVSDLQKAFWSELVSRTWQESPTRGELLDDYVRNVIATGKERYYKEWKTPPRKRLLIPWAKKQRVTRDAFDNYKPPPRDQHVWLPVVAVEEDSEPEEWDPDLYSLEAGERLFGAVAPLPE